jgi:hypothetical protein
LFKYKASEFELPPFPGYSTDQWGIKAHNRPWIVENGRWESGQKIIEPGGAYSRLPEWLGETFDLEPWIGDDFGESTGEGLWLRWGNPRDLPTKYPSVRYQFERFGPGSSYPTAHFDRVFSVSTLEHIPQPERLGALIDMHRCLAPYGIELHTIDIHIPKPWHLLVAAAGDVTRLGRWIDKKYINSIGAWIRLFRRSGVEFEAATPSAVRLLDRSILVESADVVFRLFDPVDTPKPYQPSASLLLVIERRG